MTKFADQLGFPEAPVLLPDGDFLFVEMDPAKGWVIRFSRDGKTRTVLAKTGRPNGLRSGSARQRLGGRDRDARAPAHEPRWQVRSHRQRMRRRALPVPERPGARAQRRHLPRPIRVSRSRSSRRAAQLNPDFRKLRYDGRVFRIDPRTRAVECVDRGLLFTNGIAFGPDQHLYVAEIAERQHLSLRVS